MPSTIKEPPPTIKTSTSQNLLLAIPYTILFSNFEKLQGQGNVIPASMGRDYLSTQGLGGNFNGFISHSLKMERQCRLPVIKCICQNII